MSIFSWLGTLLHIVDTAVEKHRDTNSQNYWIYILTGEKEISQIIL